MRICDFQFLNSSFKEKLHLGPRPPVFDNLNIVLPVNIAEVYSITSQSFMLLHTREIGELVIFKGLYIPKKGEKTFWAPSPNEGEF